MYCSVQDVKNRNTTILSNVPSADIETEIAMAQSIVDGMLGGGYTVPFTSVPNLVTLITADLAASALIGRRVGQQGKNKQPLQSDSLYDRATKLLENIRDGKMALDVGAVAGAISSTYEETPQFYGWKPEDPNTYRDINPFASSLYLSWTEMPGDA